MPAGKLYRSHARKLNRKQVKQVQKIVDKNLLLKQRYTASQINKAIPITGTLEEITGITHGDEFNDRDSNRLRLLSYNAKYTLNTVTSLALGSYTVYNVRMLIARSKMGTLVLADFPTTVTGQPDLDKMQVYHDRIHTVQPIVTNTTNGTAMGQVVINDVQDYKSFHNKKVPHLNIGYDAAADSVANDNPIYILFIADIVGVNYTGWTHVKFYDKD